MTRSFTVAEAGTVTGLRAKAIQNAIDKRIVGSVGPAYGRRMLSGEDLVRLVVWDRTGAAFPSEQRDRLFAAMAVSPPADILRVGPLLMVDMAEARRQVERGLRDLEAAEAVVVRDPEIFGGEPVISGTRVPAHAIAAMLAAGASAEELLAGYPALSRRQLDLVRVWARAQPRRGRPSRSSELGLKVKRSRRVPLKDDPLTSRCKPVAPAAE